MELSLTSGMPMTQLKSSALLQNASVAIAVGDRPKSARSSFQQLGLATVLLLAGAAGTAQAQDHGNNYTRVNDQQSSQQEQPKVIGEVVSIRHIDPNEVQDPNRSHRGEISPRSIAGAIVGGFLGHQVGGGQGKRLTTILGAIGGGSLANRLASRRHASEQSVGEGYDNARQVQDNNLVTVSVQVGGKYETYEIVQPAAIELMRGQKVELGTTDGGKTLLARPLEQQAMQSPKRKSPGR
jgi:uncharacterized protein YcfJ